MERVGKTARGRTYVVTPPRERLNKYVDTTRSVGECWIWGGATSAKDGYGRFWMGGKWMLAHRATYELFRGKIPDGLQIDHLCRNRGCVNPWHLEPVTNRENQMRSPIALPAMHARKTHCDAGHELTPENTYVHRRPGSTARRCRICQKRWRREMYEREVAAKAARQSSSPAVAPEATT